MADAPVEPAVNGKKEVTDSEVKREPRKPVTREEGKGVVKAVPAGDSVVVLQMNSKAEAQGPPKEREIVLTNIKAPRLGRRGPADKPERTTQDEPFAWQAREFLRKKVVGKQVSFVVEHKDVKSSKEYGYVFLLSDKAPENLAKTLLNEGYAEVRTNSRDRPELEELIKAEEAAKKDGKGMHKADVPPEVQVRRQPSNVNTELFGATKGVPQQGIIEQVITGSTLRVLLLPSFHEIKLLLSGVEAPQTARDNEVAAPFSREAKFFTEHYLLHRDVQVLIEAADQSNFYGTVTYGGHNIGEELLKSGLARFVDWSAARTAQAEKLRAAERFAKEKKLRLWSSYVEPAKLSRQEEKAKPKVGKEFIGKVVDIQNITTIAVLDAQGNEVKVNLSSVRPRFGGPPPARGAQREPRDEKTEARDKAQLFAAKEFLRRRLIGQRVRCVLDYTRASEPRDSPIPGRAPAPGRAAPAPAGDRGFYTVYLDKLNVAVSLVENGYADAVYHRAGEPRAKDFEEILAAESVAKKAAKNKDSDASIPHINDLSLDPTKSRQFLPFLKRAGRLRGVVEYEFSGSRLKIFVPKESCLITLALAGVRVARQGEPFSNEAKKFAREQVHQHDIDFEVFSQDKGGNFIGNVWVNKKSMAALLLEEGLAQIQKVSLEETGAIAEYSIAEDSAKKARKNMWKDYDEAVEEAKRIKRAEEREAQLKPKQELVDVIVTEIVDATTFYVQVVGPEAEQLEDLMKALSLQPEQGPHSPAVGELVSAQFTEDDAWYRAKTVSVNADQATVFYVDYGNSESLPTSRIRPLPSDLPKLAHQAHQAQLAYIRPPTLNEDYGPEAAEYLKELVWGKTVVANIEYRDDAKMFLSLGERETGVHINGALVKAGLAKVEKLRGKHLQPVLDKLREEENVARKAHLGIYAYGDPGSDEDDL